MRYAARNILVFIALMLAIPAAVAQPGLGDIDATTRERARMSTDQLSLELMPVPMDELTSSAAEWQTSLRGAASRLAEAAAEGLPTDDLRGVTADLVVRYRVFLDEIERKGGAVAADRSYVLGIERLLQETGDPDSSAADGDAPAGSMEARVAAEARRIQSDPPVHERAEPWAVPVTEFLNELQPLTRDQIDERVQIWLQLLQDEVRKRNRLNIAAEQTEDNALRQALFDEAAKQQARISQIVERVNAAIEALQRRGGDVADYRRYVANVTGVQVNLADPAVLTAQALAWLKSPDGGIAVGIRILTFVAILVVAWIVSRIVGGIVATAVSRVPKASSLLQSFLVGGAKRVVMLIGLVVAISRLGVDITPLIAAIGAAGLVVGLALQGTLGNFASGILILIYRPYDVGDFISAGGASGKVEDMNLVSTRISTFDNQVLFVPNNQVWGGVITNINGRSTRRVDMTFGIAYDADMAKAEKVIREVIGKHEKVLQTPEPTIKVHELADNSVNFIVRPWSNVADYWDVYWDVTRGIKERFDEEGIGIPFPQRDLHLPEPIEVVVKS